MRKLGRMVRRVLTAVSLLLFLAVLAAWVRSALMMEIVRVERISLNELSREKRDWSVGWGMGELGITYGSECCQATGVEGAGGRFVEWRSDTDRDVSRPITAEYARIFKLNSHLADWIGADVNQWSHWGIYLAGYDNNSDSALFGKAYVPARTRERWIAFPCWMAAIVFGALPSWRCFVWWRGVRRRRVALQAGRCQVCGYDLRASPQRCPECGTARGAV